MLTMCFLVTHPSINRSLRIQSQLQQQQQQLVGLTRGCAMAMQWTVLWLWCYNHSVCTAADGGGATICLQHASLFSITLIILCFVPGINRESPPPLLDIADKPARYIELFMYLRRLHVLLRCIETELTKCRTVVKVKYIQYATSL